MILGSYGSLLAASPVTMSAILLELRPFLGSFLLLSLTPFVLFGLSSRIALIRSSPARPARFTFCAVFYVQFSFWRRLCGPLASRRWLWGADCVG
jgi:hypothetical protein